jgi:broad specificity phosphatase PhoE
VTRADPLEALGLSLRGGAAELHLIRHADAVPPGDGPIAYEQYEAQPLSARGEAQAQALAARCEGLGLAAVYASPIRRAQQTAEAIAAAAGVTVGIRSDLREIAIGPVDDTSMSLRDRLAWLALVALRDGSWEAIPGTEPAAAVRSRMMHALREIAAQHAGSRVAVVSHAGSINAALGVVVATANDFVFPLANTAVSIVRIGGDRTLLVSANDTSHLRALGRDDAAMG